jgi:mannan endo-1,4-beta-mannosidase
VFLNNRWCSPERPFLLPVGPGAACLEEVVRALLATLAILVAAVAAVAGAPVEAGAVSPPMPPAKRTFGVFVDPWNVDDWARAVGSSPQLVAEFEAFSRNQVLDHHLREAELQGIRSLMFTWEPWKPVPTSLGPYEQYRPQPGYRNGDIARGAQDEYIARFARSLAGFQGTVYVRYAHEMNGFWYPWAHGPRQYVQAWRRVVSIFRQVGAANVRFVWSPNPNLFQRQAEWVRKLRRYWPGSGYVDAVGSTMINFGGRKDYRVARWVPRLRDLRRRYRKPVMLTETNTAYRGRVRWLMDLRRMLRRTPWIRAVVWSQLASRGKANMHDAGRVDWDVRRDPAAAAVLRQIIRDGRL